VSNIVRAVLTIVGFFALNFGSASLAGQEGPTIFDKDIRVLEFEEVRYPPQARASRIQGIVVVRVTLDDVGKVTGALAVSGADAFVSDCLENVKKWRFQPNARRSAIIVYNFRMPGGECKSISSMFMLRRPNLAIVSGCDTSSNK
jgi:TonB family protein